jgi:tRNA threonylcarbamoyladenosine biosynthesis protein TsaB
MSKSSKRLILDTATKYLYVALFQGNECLESHYAEGKNNHSEVLMNVIQQQFQQRKWSVSDLDEIIVGIGPGSYTGLRIGVVVAKMFGWSHHIPVKTISSLALLASAHHQEGLVLAEMDARRGNSFLGLYKNTGKTLELDDKEQLTNLEEYKSLIGKPYTVVSVGEPNIPLLLGSNLLVEVQDIHALSPNYLRKTEAERNLESS